MKCLMSKKIGVALTGGNGYIASSFISRTEAEDWVSISLIDLPPGFRLFHLAAVAALNENSDNIIENNVGLDLDVVNHARSKNLKLVYFSSNNVYPLKVNCDIDDAQFNRGPYSQAKYIGEYLVETLEKDFFVILRLADVFGKGQKHGNFFRAIEVSLSNGHKLQLYGRGNKLRSYIYIEELVELMIYIASAETRLVFNGGKFNVGFQATATNFELMHMVSKFSSLGIEEVEYPLDKEKSDIRTVDVTTEVIPGYQYKYTLTEALQEYVEKIRGAK